MTRDSALEAALLDTGFELKTLAGAVVRCRPLSPPAFVMLRRVGCVLVDPKADKSQLDEVDYLAAFTQLAFILSEKPETVVTLSRNRDHFEHACEVFGQQFAVGEFSRLMEGLDVAAAGIVASRVTAKKKQARPASRPASRKRA